MTNSSPQTVHFQRTREQRFLEVAEDYTELIADLIAAQGKARVCDIARVLGVSHVSVLKAVGRLVRDGYLIKDAGATIELSPQGQQMAAFAKRKHKVLTAFLHMLGVPEETAASDVEGLEHHISAVTLCALEAHMQRWHRLVEGGQLSL